MMNKNKKKIYIEEMKGFFNKTTSVFVTHYQGLTVKQIDKLRAEMRKHGILFKITKNRITKLAMEGSKFKKLENLFSGPTAVGPLKSSSSFLNFVPSKASLVIRFLVILKRIPCFLISDFKSSICLTLSP